VFKQLVAEVSALGFSVRQLRSDNGGEYTSKEFKDYCTQHSISQQFTPPNTPRSNSISERFNRVLVERARTSLDSAHLPKFLWAAAMAAVTYLYNRTISAVHVSKTPFELLFGTKPNVRNLRAYGCSAYMYNFAAQGKLDRRAFKGALVGYDNLSSSYLIYVPETQSIRRSSHVHFHEHKTLFTAAECAMAEHSYLRASLHSKITDLSKSRSPGPPKPTAAERALIKSAARISAAASATVAAAPSAPAPAPAVLDDLSVLPAVDLAAPTAVHREAPLAVTPDDQLASQGAPILPVNLPPPSAPSQGAPPSPVSTVGNKRGRAIKSATPLLVTKSGRVSKATPAMSAYRDRLHFVDAEEVVDVEQLFHVMEVSGQSLPAEAPSSFANIAKWPDRDLWYAAVEAENASIDRHCVLVPVDSLPPGRNLVKAMYIFKRKADGRYKVRLVAKGFTQVEGVDYFEIFAPVVSKNTLRLLLALAASNDWDIHQMDVETAFLYGDLDEEIYMEAPAGSRFPKGSVLRLNKALYGLKQAPRQWNKTLDAFVRGQGFKRCVIDPSLYVRGSGSSIVLLAVYVDDLLIFGNDSVFISTFKTALSSRFTMKDLGQVRDILGMSVTRDRAKRTLSLSQSAYIRRLVAKFRLDPDQISSSRSVPMTKTMWTTAVDVDHALGTPLDTTELPYRSLLGGLLYTNVCCRPDISFAISALASHSANPMRMHWQGLMDVLAYIRDTQDLCITYGGIVSPDQLNQLVVYADADFSRHPERRKSRSGQVIYLNNGAIGWKSSLQKRIATSTSESELYSMYDASRHAKWFRELLGEIGFAQRTIICHEDNKGVVDWIATAKASSRMLHLDIEYYWLREVHDLGFFSYVLTPTALQIADILTKQMDPTLFYTLLRMLYNLDKFS
jgi:hypothetical protein